MKKTSDNKKMKKGVDTMLRITSSNNQKLSDMADNKAHIMISVNSIILSVVISVILRKMEDHPNLLLPTSFLLLINVSTLIFAVLATRPSIPDGTFTAEQIENREVNLLFFGNFYKMSLTDYNVSMHSMMNNTRYLYDNLIQDVYSQGVVLSKKYMLLRISYNIFMYGIIVAVMGFVLASIIV